MPLVKRMIAVEMQVRREKGLCYTCDAKILPAHRCPNRQLMMLLNEDDKDIPFIEEVEIKEPEVTLHHLSLHALRGTQGPTTIQFNGEIQGTKVQILLDGGSSDNNFLHPRIVQHLKILVELTPEVKVLGGIGRILTHSKLTDAFNWSNETQSAFDNLNRALTSSPVLALLNFVKTFVLETDAFGAAIGVVLSQDDHSMAFFSKKLSP
ncbi:uncharacterized protein LOC114728840 [Neltuma alba]|uniref:uncharacterized protein LOC114728840 n=1 Tax=Neltuma alba TaxID=207710 RepID=UPI0010A2F291|nr:uncharacterized protein LOC114728840 [Prosopis alba]